MKTPDTIMGEVRTRGDFRQLSASALSDVKRQSDTPDLPDGHPLWELWESMTEFYGAAFLSQYGDRPTWAWLEALQDLSVADYGTGMAALKNRTSSFPPNPGEFRAMAGVSWEHRRQAEGQPVIAPIALPREEALARLAQIREEFGI
jgi:hypothetical protein